MADSREYYKEILKDNDNDLKILIPQDVVNYVGNFIINIIDYFFNEITVKNTIKKIKKQFNNELIEYLIECGNSAVDRFNIGKTGFSVLGGFISIKTEYDAFGAGFIDNLLKEIFFSIPINCCFGGRVIDNMKYVNLKSVKDYIIDDVDLSELYDYVSKNEDDDRDIYRNLYDLYDLNTAFNNKDKEQIEEVINDIKNTDNITLINLANNYPNCISYIRNSSYFKSIKFCKNILYVENKDVHLNNVFNIVDNTKTFIDIFIDTFSIKDNIDINYNSLSVNNNVYEKHYKCFYFSKLKDPRFQNPYINLYFYIKKYVLERGMMIIEEKIIKSFQRLYKSLKYSGRFSRYIFKILTHKESLNDEYKFLLESDLSIELYENILENFYDKTFNFNLSVLKKVLKEKRFIMKTAYYIASLLEYVISTVTSLYKFSALFSIYKRPFRPKESFTCISYTNRFHRIFLHESLTYLQFTKIF